MAQTEESPGAASSVDNGALSFTLPVTHRLKNGPAQVVVGVEDGRLIHVAVTASGKGRIAYLKGDPFAIELESGEVRSEDFQVVSARDDEPGAMDFLLRSDKLSLEVLLHYRQGKGDLYIEKWIEVRPDPGKKVFVKRLVLERFKTWDEFQDFKGPGQPVYVADTFWGVAYPAADNHVDSGGLLECSYPVGLTVGEQGYVSRKSVYGISRESRVKQDFLAYIDKIRARPAAPFLLYNTWYDLFNFSDREVIDSISGFKEKLVDGRGIKLDSVVLDDGWDDWYDLWAPHRKRFPQGFGPVAEAAESVGAHLGLWMSPIGGYAMNHNRRIFGTLGKGYEKNTVGFCFAGKTYKDTFRERMISYIRDYGVNYYKLDNLNTICNSPFHGHRTGPYAQAGLTDAFIEVLTDVRKADPQVMINFTVGSWLSPWWLQYADVLWRGGWDFSFEGPGSPRQQSITYVDKILYKRLVEEGAQFPVSSIMTHGVIKGKRQSFGETGENLRDFSDDCWMYFGRGVMMQELYLSPELLSDREWDVLAEAIEFSRKNWDVLRYTEMAGGDPAKGEVYWFLHRSGGRSLVLMRNPADKEVAFVEPGGTDDSTMRDCAVLYSSTGKDASDSFDSLEVRLLDCSSNKGAK